MQSFNNYKFEILWVTKKQELNEHLDLVKDFFDLYQHPSNFPDLDELEDPIYIQDRIANGNSNPYTHLLLYMLVSLEGERKFLGGCIVEFYPDSACALVTYLFVDKAWRGVGIGSRNEKVGESLIRDEKGLKGLVRFFEEQYGKRVNAVFFESNNPADTPAANDSMPPAKRLKFFSRMGARRVAFNYIQPPLGDDKGIVTNLFLMIFPELTGLHDTVPVLVVMRFVMELAKSLDQNKQPNSKSLYGAINYSHDVKELEENPESGEANLTGLVADGRNIILETYMELVKQQVGGKSVALVSCFL